MPWLSARRIALALALACLPRCAAAQQPPKAEPAEAVVQRVSRDLLDEIRGLDSRRAHFFVLVDVSGSAYELSSVSHQLYNFLVEYFWVEGDKLTVVPFFTNPLVTDLLSETLVYSRDTKQVILAKYPMTSTRDEWGTDLRAPVYAVLKHCQDQGLFEKELIVILRLSDQADTNEAEFRGRTPPFPRTAEEEQEFGALLGLLAARPDHRPAAAVLKGEPYLIQGTSRPLHIAAWYSGDHHRFPVVPFPELDRERWTSDRRLGALRRPFWRNQSLVFRWDECAGAEAYVLYASNDEVELRKALRSRTEAARVRRISLEAEALTPVPDRPGVMEKAYDDLAAFAAGKLELAKASYVGLHVVSDGEEELPSADRVREVPPLPPPPPLSVWERVTRFAGRYWLLPLALALLLYGFLPQLYHIVSQGERRWHVLCGSRGVPVRCMLDSDLEEPDSKSIRLPTPLNAAALSGQAISVLRAAPTWLPAKLRGSLVAEGTSAARVATNGSPEGKLKHGAENELVATARDGSEVMVRYSLFAERFWRRYWHKLAPIMVLSALGIVLLLISLLGPH